MGVSFLKPMRVQSSLIVLFLLFCETLQESEQEGDILFTEENVSHKYIFLFVSLVILGVVRYFVDCWGVVVPHAIFATVLGLLWGIGCLYYEWMVEVSVISKFTMMYLPYFHLPIILFTTAFCLDVHIFMKCLSQILVISIPIAIITAITTGLLMRQVLDSGWDVTYAIILGMIYFPVYPMDVVRFLQGTSVHMKYVAVLLEGETVVTTVVTVIVFQLLIHHITGWIVHWYQVAMGFVRMVGIGAPVGYLFGKLSIFLMKFAYNDICDLILLTVVSCFLSFYVGIYMAKAGILSCVITGSMMGKERPSLSREVEESLISVWKLLSIIVNSVVLVSIGVITPQYIQEAQFYFNDLFIVCVSYLMVNIWRFFSMFLFSPILSRLGYGMSFRSLIVLAWGGLKSPFTPFLAVELINAKVASEITNLIFLHTVGVYILMMLINASLAPVLCRTLGLSDISVSKQVNMENCMTYIHDARARVVAILKMDRLLSDANWPLVMNFTNLKHPYKKIYQANVDEEAEEEDDDYEYFLRYRYTYCPDCQKHISNEPTNKEMREMTKEAKMRMLKHKKTVYSRQYENGMMSKECARILQQVVEIAMDSEELVIQLDGLFRLFSKESYVDRFVKSHLPGLLVTRAEILKPPRHKLRLLCYNITRHIAFSVLMHTLILCNMILVTINFKVKYDGEASAKNISVHVIRLLFFVIYVAEFWLKVLSYSWSSIKQGLKSYFTMSGNVLDFIALVICLIHVLMNTVLILAVNDVFELWYISLIYNLLLSARLFRILSWYFAIGQHFKKVANGILRFLSLETGKSKALAYELGKNYIGGEDEVLENLPRLVDNEKLQKQLREKMEQDKLAVTRRLGLLQMAAPWVTTTVKTRMAIRTVLNGLRDEIFELKVSGWVDDVECNKLLTALAAQYKNISSIKNVKPSSPKLIFWEVPYLCEDEEVLRYLDHNICTRKFDPENEVYKQGEPVEGIYILITGMFKVTYTPEKSIVERANELGCIPVVDYLYPNMNDTGMVEYITPGNTMGELSTITNRAYDGTIVAETHSEVYLLKRDVVKAAIEMDPDPVNGLKCRIWKAISFRKAVTVLTTVPAYRAYTNEKILYTLERAFVPNLSNYKIFVVSEMMEDIILIEGVVVDLNTRDPYIAPCYIPRAVQKLVLSTSSIWNMEGAVQTQLMIIPAKNINEYEIMVHEESICELVDATSSTKCLRHMIDKRKHQKLPKTQKSKFQLSARFKKVMYGEETTFGKTTYGRSRSSKLFKMSSKSSNLSKKSAQLGQ